MPSNPPTITHDAPVTARAPRPAQPTEPAAPTAPDTAAAEARLPFRYRLEAIALGAAERLVPMLPRAAMLAVARAAGWMAYHVLGEDRRVAFANLDLVFGDSRSRAEKKRIVRTTFRNLATNILGLFWGANLNEQNITRYVEADWEWLKAVQNRGKGAIFISCHYGDWELMSLASGLSGARYVSVMESTKNPVVAQTIARLRGRGGHTTVEPRFAVIKLFKTLKRGGTVALLIDVNSRRGRGGVWLDFFGVPVFNTAAVAELAIKTGAPIVFGASRPLPGSGRRIRVDFGPEIEPSATGDRDRDIRETSQRCLDCCAELIRREPEHWLWTYKRWKRRPAPDAPGHPFYAKYDPNT